MIRSAAGIRRDYQRGLARPRASRAPMWIALGAVLVLAAGGHVLLTGRSPTDALPTITHKRGLGAYDGAAHFLHFDPSEARDAIEAAEAGDRGAIDRLAKMCVAMDHLQGFLLEHRERRHSDDELLVEAQQFLASDVGRFETEECRKALRVDVTWLLAK